MSYYRKTTLFTVGGVICLAVGLFLLVVGSGVGGAAAINGVVFLAIASHHRSNPMLTLEDDHLAYEPAMLRSTRLVSRDEIESIETPNQKVVQIHLFDGDVIKLPAKEIEQTSPDEFERGLNDWLAQAA